MVQRLSINGIAQRLTQALVIAPRVVAFFAIVDVEGDALVAKRNSTVDDYAIVAIGLCQIGRGEPFQHVDIARLQVGQTHGGVGDRQESDTVKMDRIGVPIICELGQYYLVLRHPLGEAERAGADRVQAKISARCGGGGGRNHHTSAVGQLSEKCGIGPCKVELDFILARHFGRGDRLQLGFAAGFVHRLGAFDICGHGLRVERCAVMEHNPLAQLHGDRSTVLRGGPRCGQLWYNLKVWRDVDQLVAHRRIDDPAHKCAGLIRVKHIGIRLQRDAQVFGDDGAGHECGRTQQRRNHGSLKM